MKTLFYTAATFLMTGAAFGQGNDPLADCGKPGAAPCDVPEISALEGTAALAALAAIVFLAWERRRRAA